MKKKDGFKGERSIQLPQRILEKISKRDIYKSLFITFIGYYPKAEFHYRERKNGASESILIYCVDGNGWIKINNKIIKIKPNEFFAIPKGIPHSYGCNEKEPWTIYWLHFNGSNSDNSICII
jgi:AraC family transcriptional regulator of arabinose operon